MLGDPSGGGVRGGGRIRERSLPTMALLVDARPSGMSDVPEAKALGVDHRATLAL